MSDKSYRKFGNFEIPDFGVQDSAIDTFQGSPKEIINHLKETYGNDKFKEVYMRYYNNDRFYHAREGEVKPVPYILALVERDLYYNHNFEDVHNYSNEKVVKSRKNDLDKSKSQLERC